MCLIFLRRCQTKGAVQFYKSVPNKQRFSIQPDRLNGKNSAMYIHCTVFMCHRDSTDERCHSGCQDNNVKRVRRDLSGGYGEVAPATELKYYFLEVGPIEIAETKSSGARSFIIYLRMYTDGSYSALNLEYPFRIKPRDYVYLEAYASVSDKKLVVLIDQCYATPTMQHDDPEKKVFIEGG